MFPYIWISRIIQCFLINANQGIQLLLTRAYASFTRTAISQLVTILSQYFATFTFLFHQQGSAYLLHHNIPDYVQFLVGPKYTCRNDDAPSLFPQLAETPKFHYVPYSTTGRTRLSKRWHIKDGFGWKRWDDTLTVDFDGESCQLIRLNFDSRLES